MAAGYVVTGVVVSGAGVSAYLLHKTLRLANTWLSTPMAKDTLPAPEDNVKPVDYKELFEVREAKPRKLVE
jgi:hypothetical protein